MQSTENKKSYHKPRFSRIGKLEQLTQLGTDIGGELMGGIS